MNNNLYIVDFLQAYVRENKEEALCKIASREVVRAEFIQFLNALIEAYKFGALPRVFIQAMRGFVKEAQGSQEFTPVMKEITLFYLYVVDHAQGA